MKNWTRSDLAMTAVAILASLSVVGFGLLQQSATHGSAMKVVANIESIAAGVAVHHQQTGQWFPDEAIRVFPDPFREEPQHFQGVDPQWLAPENNDGLVLQLVRFDPESDLVHKQRLFSDPYRQNEPYIRILMDYGPNRQVELTRLRDVRNLLPEGSMISVDDLYYVIDLRRIVHDE